MISEIKQTTIDNVNKAKIRYMNYESLITVIRNSGLKFICMILLNFQIFALARKKRKCPFIKFSINMYACLLQKGLPFSFQFSPEHNILGH